MSIGHLQSNESRSSSAISKLEIAVLKSEARALQTTASYLLIVYKPYYCDGKRESNPPGEAICWF